MLGNEEEIQKLYDDMLATRTNQYNQRKQDTANQYKSIYSDLQNQQQEGESKLYNDRNQIAVDNSQHMQQIRDYMARNNLLQSGESPDAMMRENTDFSNRLGENKTNQFNLMRDINSKRNQYNTQEQSTYNDLGNQLTSDTTDINYKRLNEINALRQYQQQQAAARASTSRSGGSSSTSAKANISKDPYGNDNQKNIYDFYSDNKVAYGDKMDALAQIINDNGYSQEDRDYADRMRQALRSQSYYDAAYANYRGGY